MGNSFSPSEGSLLLMGQTTGQYVCISPKRVSSNQLLHLKRVPSGLWARCAPPGVDLQLYVHVPANTSNSLDSRETLSLERDFKPDHPLVT